ncbi:helix-turn-helix domain-containing protein [Flavobacterium caseinilyticum]|uniref:DNA-binding protein n=1 Tax=Flavobacterium caseinilyticum TaxID=2541732 RepID=A0A4R5ASD4_9FLAO|nr:helix-turn-helix domain-containing protein [Flavobacterium caseinilyticum]TDD74606.1 DNA-binding protein [Flavobacterium caseinilyticum]
MENPFELILEKLERIEIAIQKLNAPPQNDGEILLSRLETAKLLKINLTSLWKHTKSGKLKSYGIGNRVFYKKDEVLKSLTRIN